MKKSVFGDLEWWRELERKEEERKKKMLKLCKCYGCVWFREDSQYCPFKKCFKGKWGEY